MTLQQRLPVYDPAVVIAFWRAQLQRRPGEGSFINGQRLDTTGGSFLRRFKRRGEGVRERSLEAQLHAFGLTLSDFEQWARAHYDGWTGRWIPHWEKEIA